MSQQINYIDFTATPTLAALFDARCRQTPDGLAYMQYEDDDWQPCLWAEMRDEVGRWQAALHAEGLQRGDRVAIMCSNRREWVLFDLAAQGLGLVTVPLYTNDRADNVSWIIADSGARLLMVETFAQCQQLEATGERTSTLERIVCLEDIAASTARVTSVYQWLPESSGGYVLDSIDGDDLATIVYTSGTTGRPKGVMLSHRNILFNVEAALEVFAVYPQDLLLSFLPLSHALERTVGYYLPMAAGAAIAYNRSIPQLADDLAAIRPTLMISVPRIFERVHGKIQDKLATESGIKRWLFNSAVETGWAHFLHRQGRGPWKASFLARPLLDALVGSKVRAKMGGRLRFTVCGGAALAPDIAKMFIGLGIPVTQGYGLTETAPVIAANPLDNNVPASVGLPLPGIETALGPDDELLTRSPSVMLGYWRNDEATRAVIDEHGWLHTGDKVRIDATGHIEITGRLKDIIVLSNGEKVPPGDMETAIVMDELVDQVLVIGEGRPYLSALVVPNPEAFARVAESLHLNPANEDTCCDDNVRSIFLQHVQQRMSAFPGYAQVRELAVVNEPWTPDNGLATPTLKLRRRQILDRYRDITDKLYAGH
jgi:long-chain acyl-CoA synthetase